jgi:hypothetical protein
MAKTATSQKLGYIEYFLSALTKMLLILTHFEIGDEPKIVFCTKPSVKTTQFKWAVAVFAAWPLSPVGELSLADAEQQCHC